jgi:hypothetical protein
MPSISGFGFNTITTTTSKTTVGNRDTHLVRPSPTSAQYAVNHHLLQHLYGNGSTSLTMIPFHGSFNFELSMVASRGIA